MSEEKIFIPLASTDGQPWMGHLDQAILSWEMGGLGGRFR